MVVTLPPQLEAFVQEKVESGRYRDAAEVVADALHLLEERDHRERLQAAVAKGLAQFERGEVVRYTPELLERIDQAAIRKAKEGRAPKADVVP